MQMRHAAAQMNANFIEHLDVLQRSRVIEHVHRHYVSEALQMRNQTLSNRRTNDLQSEDIQSMKNLTYAMMMDDTHTHTE